MQATTKQSGKSQLLKVRGSKKSFLKYNIQFSLNAFFTKASVSINIYFTFYFADKKNEINPTQKCYYKSNSL